MHIPEDTVGGALHQVHGPVAASGASGAVASVALFRPVRAGNAFEETVERILTAVRLGLLAPGERLPPERALAARLNVSRVTLQAAIKALREAGYVESRRGRTGGTFVTGRPEPPARLASRATTAEELSDILAFREVVETGTAGAAARRETSEAAGSHLLRWLEESQRADLATYRRLDSRLHLAVAELTGSASLVAAVADVRLRLNHLLDAIPLLVHNVEHSHEQHAAIVDAVLSGAPDKAERAMRDHLAGTTSLLRGFLG
jgi:DNA-binding FadR family transcriptional regulator